MEQCRVAMEQQHNKPWDTSGGHVLPCPTWLQPGLKRGISTWRGEGSKTGNGSQGMRLPDPTWIAPGAEKEGWALKEDGLTLAQIQVQSSSPVPNWDPGGCWEQLWDSGWDSPAWIHPPGLLLLCLSWRVKLRVLIQAGTQPGNSQSRVGVVA